MARAILAVDMVSIGLIFSDGDLNINMGDIINKVDEFERLNNRVIGAESEDYGSAILELTFDMETYVTFLDHNKENGTDMEWNYGNYLFRELIPKMLNYNYVYFNDSDICWENFERVDELTKDDYWILQCNRNVYEIKLNRHKYLAEFFSNNKSNEISQDQMKEIMLKLGIEEKLLFELIFNEYDWL